VCREQAMNASKRRGTDKDVASLLSVATNFEQVYSEDTTRLMRAIQSPKETNANIVDEGDVMLGTLARKSLRTGFMSPLSATIPLEAAVLLEPDQRDAEDDNIRVVWQRNKNYEFYSYELWMDSRPEVQREREGGIVSPGIPNAFLLTNGDTIRDGAKRQTTSIMVFRSFGGNSNSSRSSFSTFVEEFGQLIRSFAVSGLESSTTYYFRLYVIGINYDEVSSNVVRVQTKALRARFLQVYPDPNFPSGPTGTALNLTSGPPGTVVTVFLNNIKGAITAAHTVKLGPKVVPITIVNPYQFTFTVPAFQNISRPLDIAIISPNQLVDVLPQAFTVSSS
jgi:hypothetical protein